MTPEQTLLDMKSKIAKAKTEKAQIDGETTQLMSQLKEEGALHLADAENIISKGKREVESLEKEFATLVEDLQKNYNWEN